MTSRRGVGCFIQKPLDRFYKNGKDRHGRQRYKQPCKDCWGEGAPPPSAPAGQSSEGGPSDGEALSALLAQIDATDKSLRKTFAVQIKEIAEIDALPAAQRIAAMRTVRRMAAAEISKALEKRAEEGRSLQVQSDACERFIALLGEDYAPDS